MNTIKEFVVDLIERMWGILSRNFGRRVVSPKDANIIRYFEMPCEEECTCESFSEDSSCFVESEGCCNEDCDCDGSCGDSCKCKTES